MKEFLGKPSEAMVQIKSLSDSLSPASYCPRENFKTISEPMQNQWSRRTSGQSDGIELVNNYRESQTILQPMQNPWSEKTGGQSNGDEFVNNHQESSDPEVNRGAGLGQSRCYGDDRYGHFSRDCKNHEDEMEVRWDEETKVLDWGRIQQKGVDLFLEPWETVTR